MLLIGREREKGRIGKIPGPSPSKSGKSRKNRESPIKDKKGQKGKDKSRLGKRPRLKPVWRPLRSRDLSFSDSDRTSQLRSRDPPVHYALLPRSFLFVFFVLLRFPLLLGAGGVFPFGGSPPEKNPCFLSGISLLLTKQNKDPGKASIESILRYFKRGRSRGGALREFVANCTLNMRRHAGISSSYIKRRVRKS